MLVLVVCAVSLQKVTKLAASSSADSSSKATDERLSLNFAGDI